MKYAVKGFLSIIGTIFLVNCNIQHIIVSNNSEIIEKASREGFKSFYSNDDIDKKLIRYLLKEKKFDFRMVDSGEMFNPTDIRVEGLPDKQLIVIGKGDENLNCILYNERGDKFTNSCLVYRRKNNLFYVYFLSVESSINDLGKLKLALKDRNYKVIH